MSTVKSKKLQVGTDASASNNFTIYQPATPDGTLRIGVGNADSPTEVGQFNANGYKPQQPVAFDVYNGSAQSVSHGTWTKIALDTETYDTNSNFDSTTNYRFTPTVAGYYQINGVVRFSQVNQLFICAIYKNGSQHKSGGRNQIVGTAYEQNVLVSSVVYMNGSTDYIELYAYQSSGSSRNVSAGPSLSYFNGILIAQA